MSECEDCTKISRMIKCYLSFLYVCVLLLLMLIPSLYDLLKVLFVFSGSAFSYHNSIFQVIYSDFKQHFLCFFLSGYKRACFFLKCVRKLNLGDHPHTIQDKIIQNKNQFAKANAQCSEKNYLKC